MSRFNTKRHALVGLSPPVKTGNPIVIGTAQVGQTLTATHGTYTGTVTSYSGQWYSGASPIALATSLSYTIVSGDLGNNITYQESASNTAGSSATGTSNALGPVVAAGTVVYDTSIGNGVDSLGFTSLPLRAGASRFYVKLTGSDSNGGTNPTLPLLTVAHAVSLMVDGRGDQVLLAEGDTFNEPIPYLIGKSGFSALNPTVIGSYDPSDPTNEAKIGMGHQRTARPKLLLTTGFQMSGGGDFGYLAIKGLDIDFQNNHDGGFGFIGRAHHVLIENNIGRSGGFTADSSDSQTVFPTTQKLIVRNNSFYGMWNQGGRTGGLYVAGYVGPTVEDNVFYHCGWKIGASRDDDISIGGASVFSHSYYLQTNTTGAVVRRNLSIDGSGDGGIARGDIDINNNLFIDCPNALGLGGGPEPETDRPSGVMISATWNAALGSANVNTGHTLGWGITTGSGLPGSRAAYNLFLRSPINTEDSATGFSNISVDTNGNGIGQESYLRFDHNLLYQWAFPPGITYFTPGVFLAQTHSFYDYNSWDKAAEGTNTNSAGTAYPNPYTASQFYNALSFADKAAFVDYAINHPEAHIQRNGLDLLFTGYGVTASTDVTAPVLSSPTVSVTGGTATIGVTTDKNNDQLFYLVTPALSTATPPTMNAPVTSTTNGTFSAGPFYYKVAAIDATGETAASNEVSVTTTGLTASIALSWTAVAGATGYRLYRGEKAGGENLVFALPNVTSFTDTFNTYTSPATPSATSASAAPVLNTPTGHTTGGTLAAGTHYYKVVAMMNADGDTVPSNEVSVVLTGNNSSVSLSWSAVAGVGYYKVYHGTSAGAENSYFVPGNATTCLDNGGVQYAPGYPADTPYHPDRIRIGRDSQMNTAPNGIITVSSTGTKTTSVALSSGKYVARFMQQDTAGNQSNVLSSASFTV